MYEYDVYLTYRIAEIKTFPVDLYKISTCAGYTVKSYTAYAEETGISMLTLLAFSKDAMTLRKEKLILLNEDQPDRRKRFSLAHELGHVILPTQNEDEADGFASELLAPSAVIHAHRLATADEVKDFFGVSISAANRAIMRYKRHFIENYDVGRLYEWFGFRELARNVNQRNVSVPSRNIFYSPVADRITIHEPDVAPQEEPDPDYDDSWGEQEKSKEVIKLERKCRYWHNKITQIDVFSDGWEETYAKYQKRLIQVKKQLEYRQGYIPPGRMSLDDIIERR